MTELVFVTFFFFSSDLVGDGIAIEKNVPNVISTEFQRSIQVTSGAFPEKPTNTRTTATITIAIVRQQIHESMSFFFQLMDTRQTMLPETNTTG